MQQFTRYLIIYDFLYALYIVRFVITISKIKKLFLLYSLSFYTIVTWKIFRDVTALAIYRRLPLQSEGFLL